MKRATITLHCGDGQLRTYDGWGAEIHGMPVVLYRRDHFWECGEPRSGRAVCGLWGCETRAAALERTRESVDHAAEDRRLTPREFLDGLVAEFAPDCEVGK